MRKEESRIDISARPAKIFPLVPAKAGPQTSRINCSSGFPLSGKEQGLCAQAICVRVRESGV